MEIKELRKQLGLTQMQLALKLKVDTGTISRNVAHIAPAKWYQFDLIG